jgi:RNA polymerase sigma-70 factor (ECF subfamily)
VSETFLAAIRNLTRTDAPIANVGGWLIGIARHKVNDCRRLAFKKIGPEESDIHSTVDDPALLLEAADTRWMVAQVMDRMDDLDRTVLEWKYIEELSAREIAERLNRTEKAVEAMLYRARNSFRELFDKMDGTNP